MNNIITGFNFSVVDLFFLFQILSDFPKTDKLNLKKLETNKKSLLKKSDNLEILNNA